MSYRHGNGHLQLRGRCGRFRTTTLRDFGLTPVDGEQTCEACGGKAFPLVTTWICMCGYQHGQVAPSGPEQAEEGK